MFVLAYRSRTFAGGVADKRKIKIAAFCRKVTAILRRCTRARKFHAEALFDEIIEIANRPKMGGVGKTDSRGRKERRTGDMVQRATLQIDARKWLLSKLLPKKYGGLRVEDSGGDNVAALIQAMHSRYNQIQEEKKLAAPDKALPEQVQ